MKWKILVLAILAIGAGQWAQAQEQWGLRLGTGSGVNGWGLNPATGLSSPYKVDVTMLSGSGFLENNYFFVRSNSLLSLAARQISGTWVASFNYEKEPQAYPNPIIIDFFDDLRERYLFASATATGPSAVFKLPGGQTLGWIVQGRIAASGMNVPNNLSYFKYDRRPDLEPFPLHRWEMGLLAWGEIGLHYGKQWETATGTFSAGVVAKYLAGAEGAYFRNNTDLDFYTKITGDTIAAERMDLSFAYTRGNLGAPPLQLERNGDGFALDLGVEWRSDQWAVGVSLIDLGAVQFSRNAVRHRAISNMQTVFPNGDFKFISSPEDIDSVASLFSLRTLGDSDASVEAGNFNVWMPTALSVQAEFMLAPVFSLHAALVQRIPHPGIAVQRGNSIMLAPRFENRWISAGLPLTVYNLEKVRVGLFFRAGPLMLGTDHVAAYIIPGRLRGADFYMALRWPFSIELKGHSGGRYTRLKRGNVKCPTF